MPYKIKRVVDTSEVPDWERRPPKYSDLVEAVMELKPNQSLPVEFPNTKEAEAARNAVRDTVNRRARTIIVRTRVVTEEDDTAILFFTRVNPATSPEPEK